MTGAQMIVGLGVLGNYGPVTVSAFHDLVYAGIDGVDISPDALSQADRERLEEQDWLWQDEVESWLHYT